MRGQIISEAPEVGAWTWTLDEMTEIEKLVCAETPTAREEIGTTMTALRKPLKMWPGLHTILGPIRKLLDLDAPFDLGEEQSEA